LAPLRENWFSTLTIEQAASSLRARKVSAVELARESLRLIHEAQPRLNAFITITDDLALEQARRADDEIARGLDRGPLHGIPYALKDNFDTRGIPTTCGSKIFNDRIPAEDSAVYEMLTSAGAVLMGKTGLHEFAYGITSNNPHFGAIRNPHDTDRIPGGSSGGSAVAVAANLVFFSIGTDTGGSIRVPASFCGCVGFKPTFDAVSRAGVFPLGFSLDHVGPITRTVRDAAIVMEAITSADAITGLRTPAPAPAMIPATVRIGIPGNFFNERLSPPVAAAYEEAILRIGSSRCRLVPVQVPDPGEINTVGRLILLCEAVSALRPWLDRRGDFGVDVLALLDQGRQVPAADYIDAQRLRGIYQKQWSKLWDSVDMILTPTTPIQAPFIGQEHVDGEDVRSVATRFVRPFNVLGIPALSVPLGNSSLPTGIQLACAADGASEMLRTAQAACDI
jgi:aspartyl-tRNA(Asn)/glutamyl-tRNA(Gln) amidotransferase subunit A